VATGQLQYAGLLGAAVPARQLNNSGFTVRVTVVGQPELNDDLFVQQIVTWWCYRAQMVVQEVNACTNPLCSECTGPLAPCLAQGENPLP
jgi:hypothetical protein